MRSWAAALALVVCLGGTAHAEPPVPAPTKTASTVNDPTARALIEELERVDAEAELERDALKEGPGFGAAFFQMIVVLGGVLALAYLILAKILPKLMRIEPPIAPRKLLQVVDRLPLDQRKSILVLKMAGQYYLVGSSEGGIELLSRLDANEVDAALKAEVAPRGPILESLLKRRPKEGEG